MTTNSPINPILSSGQQLTACGNLDVGWKDCFTSLVIALYGVSASRSIVPWYSRGTPPKRKKTDIFYLPFCFSAIYLFSYPAACLPFRLVLP